MLAVESFDNSLNLHEAAVSEIHRSKISLHHAKAGYSYPTIRLPHTFADLAGLPTKIYQTVHEGALAFLVVVAPRRETPKMSAKPSYLHNRGLGARNGAFDLVWI
jgi:hypothetical protein